MAMEFKNGQTGVDTRDNGLMTNQVDKNDSEDFTKACTPEAVPARRNFT